MILQNDFSISFTHSFKEFLQFYTKYCHQIFWGYFNFQLYRHKIRPCLCKVNKGYLQFPIYNFTYFNITQYERLSPILTRKFKISDIFNQIKPSLYLPIQGIFHINCTADSHKNFLVNSDLECHRATINISVRVYAYVPYTL